MFPEELFSQPRDFLTGKFRNIVTYTKMKRGGHFGAYEEPNLMADDINKFVKETERLLAKQANAKKTEL